MLPATAGSRRKRCRFPSSTTSRTTWPWGSRRASRRGHKVVLAGDGAEAIARFKDGDPDFSLVDIQMPVMDGFRTTARIHALQGSRWVPVVYFTDH